VVGQFPEDAVVEGHDAFVHRLRNPAQRTSELAMQGNQLRYLRDRRCTTIKAGLAVTSVHFPMVQLGHYYISLHNLYSIQSAFAIGDSAGIAFSNE
jgi:hypothetical protein